MSPRVSGIVEVLNRTVVLPSGTGIIVPPGQQWMLYSYSILPSKEYVAPVAGRDLDPLAMGTLRLVYNDKAYFDTPVLTLMDRYWRHHQVDYTIERTIHGFLKMQDEAGRTMLDVGNIKELTAQLSAIVCHAGPPLPGTFGGQMTDIGSWDDLPLVLTERSHLVCEFVGEQVPSRLDVEYRFVVRRGVV